jgi:hypothetical protein
MHLRSHAKEGKGSQWLLYSYIVCACEGACLGHLAIILGRVTGLCVQSEIFAYKIFLYMATSGNAIRYRD